jgi:hypothetical protein
MPTGAAATEAARFGNAGQRAAGGERDGQCQGE